jgi:hypothetical protein
MSNLKKIRNITIVITREDYYRNFFKTDAFIDLERNFNVSYVLSEDLPTENSERKIFYFKRNKNKTEYSKFGYRTFLLMNKNKHKSKTFKFRVERFLYPLNFDFRKIPHFKKLSIKMKIKKIVLLTLKATINNCRYLKLKVLSQEYIFNTFSKKFYTVEKNNNSLESALKISEPDLVILPFGAQELELPQVLHFCKNTKIKFYTITDNWDNLSSKSVFEDKPDFIGVWGEQSKEHAIEIQNFKENQIFLLGCPRFDMIYERREKELKNEIDFKYVLFLGHRFDWNEEVVIEILDDEISSKKELYKNTKIIYRPHPQRESRLRTIDLKNIIIDQDLKKNGTYWPSLNNYFHNIKNSIFVMGASTTGLLEAIAFYKKYMLLCYYDKKDFFNQGTLLARHTHLQNLKQIEAIEFCDNKEDISIKFRMLFEENKNNQKFDKLKANKQRDYFITGDSINTFSKNVTQSILNL